MKLTHRFAEMTDIARADESGISFWLPGLYGSLSATPTTPGWSVATIYYHTSVEAAGAAAASRVVQVDTMRDRPQAR